MGLMQLNAWEPGGKRAEYLRLIPPRCFEHLAKLNPQRYPPTPTPGSSPGSASGSISADAAFRVIADADHPQASLRVPAQRHDGDYCLSLDLEEAGAGQLEVSFIIINDLAGPRFNIDRDAEGNLTLLGTAGRNLAEERRAMEAGLGPCQVRRGLRAFGDLLPRLEAFARHHGYVALKLEPLTYHTAVMYERYGFGYLVGHHRMQRINKAFAPEGVLWRALDGSTGFRQRTFAHSALGRSWAIHDGILVALDGDPILEVQMVKVLGHDAEQRTFELSGG